MGEEFNDYMLHTRTHACERARAHTHTLISFQRFSYFSIFCRHFRLNPLPPSPPARPSTPLPSSLPPRRPPLPPQSRLPPLQKNNFQVATAGPTSKVNTLHPPPFVYFSTTTISSTAKGPSPSVPPPPILPSLPVHTFNPLLGGEKEIRRTKPNQNSAAGLLHS